MATKEVRAAGMKVIISKGRWVSVGGDSAYAGYFDETEDKGVLKVAAGAIGWFEVFVHEYGHFTQWRDQCRPWRDLKDSCQIFDAWINTGKDFSDKTVDRAYKAVRNMELDCERRAVKLIKKFDLPIDVKSYIKKANVYIYYHAYIRKYRKWYKDTAPYRSKRICKLMPTVFLGRQKYNVLPEKYEQLVTELCFKGETNENDHSGK